MKSRWCGVIAAAALAAAVAWPAGASPSSQSGKGPRPASEQASGEQAEADRPTDPIEVGALQPADASASLLESERAKTAADLARVSSGIKLSKEKISALDAEIAALAADRERLDAALVDAADKQKTVSRELAATERRIDDLSVKEAGIKTSLGKRRGVLMEVLAALERMGRTPPPALLVKPRDALGSVRSAILLGAVVPRLRKETEVLLADLQQLADVKKSILQEKTNFADQLTRHREEEARLSRLFAEKQRLEAESRDRRTAEAAHASELAARADDLQDLISSLQSDLDAARAKEEAARKLAEAQRLAEEKRRAEEEKRLAAERAAATEELAKLREDEHRAKDGGEDTQIADARPPEPTAPNGTGGRVTPGQTAASPTETETGGEAPATEEAASEPAIPADGAAEEPQGESDVRVAALEPSMPPASVQQTYDIASLRRETAQLAPAAPFSTLKGGLSKPVAGKQIIGFGERDDIGRETTGESFAARPGDVVTAPADARVLYSGPFRSYGQVLILDAGDGYHVVLAGMERIDVESGQFVSAGEPVALMGARRIASVQMAEFGAAKPALYVEFRKDGKPVDPSPWWMDEPSGRTRNDS